MSVWTKKFIYYCFFISLKNKDKSKCQDLQRGMLYFYISKYIYYHIIIIIILIIIYNPLSVVYVHSERRLPLAVMHERHFNIFKPSPVTNSQYESGASGSKNRNAAGADKSEGKNLTKNRVCKCIHNSIITSKESGVGFK